MHPLSASHALVAQLAEASASGAEGSRFESELEHNVTTACRGASGTESHRTEVTLAGWNETREVVTGTTWDWSEGTSIESGKARSCR